MIVEVTAGVIGHDGVHWGQTPQGQIVCVIVCPQATVKLGFEPQEGKEFAATAIYIAQKILVENQSAQNGAARVSSSLVGIDGLPLIKGGN